VLLLLQDHKPCKKEVKSALEIFQRELEDLASSSSATAAAAAVSGDIACEILYNTGLQLLLTDEPAQALKCFEKSALLFYNRPYLWLRMAECSIALYKQMQSTIDRQGTSAVIRAAIGSGHSRGVLLPLTTATQSHAPNSTVPADAHTSDSSSNNSTNNSSKTLEEQAHTDTTAANSSSSVSQAALISTLESASRYLRNVLYLCASAAQTDKAVAETGADVRILVLMYVYQEIVCMVYY
jgi:hypothetical protein